MAVDRSNRTTQKRVSQRTAATKGDSWHDAFLADLAENCNVANACRIAGIAKSTAYKHRDENADFAAAWDDAVEAGIQALELDLRRRARESSDTAAIFLLKAHRPDVYRENKRTELTGANGGPVETRIVFGYEDAADDSDG